MALMANHSALYLLSQRLALLTRTIRNLLLLALTVPFLRTVRSPRDKIRESAPSRIRTLQSFLHLYQASQTMYVPIARPVVDRPLKMIFVCLQ